MTAWFGVGCWRTAGLTSDPIVDVEAISHLLCRAIRVWVSGQYLGNMTRLTTHSLMPGHLVVQERDERVHHL